MKKATALFVTAAGFALFGSGAAQAQTAEYLGKVIATVTIDLTTTPISTVTCGLEVSVEDPTTGYNSESISGTATVSGSTGTCTLTIPYEWLLATTSASTDTMSFTYSVSMGDRSGSHGLGSLTGVPATGTHTMLTANTRL